MSSLRRSLSSFAVLVFLVILLAENLPASYAKEQLAPVLPVTNAVGLRQEWAVFAPNPSRVEVNTFARVSLADGTERLWFPPGGDGWFESNTAARWQKWSDRIRLDANSGDWPANASLIADDMKSEGVDPVTVELVREWSTVPLPGDGFDRNDRKEFTFFRYAVAAGTGEVVTLDDPVNEALDGSQLEKPGTDDLESGE